MADRPTPAVHAAPVWRDRADFLVQAPLPEPGHSEQLWTRQLSEREFEVCCIPFFLYDVALGDVIETNAASELVRVVRQSGRLVYRAWLGESLTPRDELSDALDALGALTEWRSADLLAIDARDLPHAQVIVDFLAAREARGDLVFESGQSV